MPKVKNDRFVNAVGVFKGKAPKTPLPLAEWTFIIYTHMKNRKIIIYTLSYNACIAYYIEL